MRDLQTDLAAALASGVTTLCRCIRLNCEDGLRIGFTDHDAPLTFDGTVFEPADGFEASQESAALGPSANEWDLRAALTDDRITQDDMLTGRYDGATIESYLVDWRNVEARELLSQGTLGQVSARDGVFQAEVRGPFSAFDRVRGRVFAARCDADLGDARCGVDLSDPALRTTATIIALPQANQPVFASLPGGDSNRLAAGTLEVSSTQRIAIREQTNEGGEVTLTLWQSPQPPLSVGQSVTLTVGCDKSFACCHQTFANAENFRGFPFMPGDDFALSYPASGDGNLDGGSLQQ